MDASVAGTADDPIIGYALEGRYEIKRFVATEQLGQVYVARDTITGGLVSVKVLAQHLAHSYEQFGRFGREMTASALVEHPHTVRMMDFGQHSLFHYLVMEYVSAVSLESFVSDKGTCDVPTAAMIAGQVCSALELAHSNNVVHRNLNPGNILLLRNAASGVYVKIRDFGLSRLHDEFGQADDGGLTQAGARVGTAEYMAPEYIGDADVNSKNDVYALGCILFYALTGEPPFTGRQGKILQAHMMADPPRLKERRPDIPDWLDELVNKMLEKEPHDRPDARTVRKELQKKTGLELDPPELVPLDETRELSGADVNYSVRRVGNEGSGAMSLGLLVGFAALAGVGVVVVIAILGLLGVVLF